MTVSVIIPTIRTEDAISSLITEIKATTDYATELIVASNDVSAARNRNIGLNMTDSEFIIMCDDDVTGFIVGWDRELIDTLVMLSASVVGARLLNPGGQLQPVNYGNYDLSKEYCQVWTMITACCVFRNTKLRFDEHYIGSGWEDTDFFRQLGGKFYVLNTVKVTHLNEHKKPNDAVNRAYYAGKWK